MRSRLFNNHLVARGFKVSTDTDLVTLVVSKDLGYQVSRGPVGTGEVIFHRAANRNDPSYSEFDGQLDIRFPDDVQQPTDVSAAQKFTLIDRQECRNAVSNDTPDIHIKVAPGVKVEMTIV